MGKTIQLFVFINTLLTGLVSAQRSVYFYNDLPMVPSVELTDDEQSVSIEDILQKQILTYQTPAELPGTSSQVVYWLRFDFQAYRSLFDKCDTLYLNTFNFERARVFMSVDGQVQSSAIHCFADSRFKSKTLGRSFIPVTRAGLLDGQYVVIETKVTFDRNRSIKIPFYLSTDNNAIQDHTFFLKIFKKQIPVFLFIGLAVALFILNLALFLNSKSLIYMFYGLFLLFQIIYYLIKHEYISAPWEYNWPLFFHILIDSVQIAINLSYLLFIRAFLDMPGNYPRLNRVVLAIACFLLLLIVTHTIILYINPFFEYQSHIMHFQRYFMALFAVYGIAHLLIYRRSSLVYFIACGTSIFVFFALMALFLDDIHYMMFGAAIECVVFAFGLAYRVKIMSDEKLVFEQEAAQLSKSALRAQMNPHFIFNSLNSIQHLITIDDKLGSLRYLSKFSHLLRQILENSIEANVPLKREIELLKLYLDLESLRFDQSFQYNVYVDKKLDVHNEEVPLFLIQPYVENAIVHGLMPKKSCERTLCIRFLDLKDHIRCEVTDNGIGREAAKALRKQRAYVSRGTSVAKRRLEIINKNKVRKTLVSFEDSYAGTKVIINIPKI